MAGTMLPANTDYLNAKKMLRKNKLKTTKLKV